MVYDFKTAFDPFINKAITYAQLPFLFKFQLVEGIATMQYKLFSPYPTWLPRPPTLKVVEDGHLPLVTLIQRDPFEWVLGERNMMGGNSIRLEHATIQQKEMSVALEREKGMIAEVAAETAHDIIDRFAREENGIFALQKRMELPPSARNKDFLTRQNTATEGYIVWLQDSEEEGEWRDAMPMPIIPHDYDIGADRGETKKQQTHCSK